MEIELAAAASGPGHFALTAQHLDSLRKPRKLATLGSLCCSFWRTDPRPGRAPEKTEARGPRSKVTPGGNSLDPTRSPVAGPAGPACTASRVAAAKAAVGPAAGNKAGQGPGGRRALQPHGGPGSPPRRLQGSQPPRPRHVRPQALLGPPSPRLRPAPVPASPRPRSARPGPASPPAACCPRSQPPGAPSPRLTGHLEPPHAEAALAGGGGGVGGQPRGGMGGWPQGGASGSSRGHAAQALGRRGLRPWEVPGRAGGGGQVGRCGLRCFSARSAWVLAQRRGASTAWVTLRLRTCHISWHLEQMNE